MNNQNATPLLTRPLGTTPDDLEQAAGVIRAGGLVAFPTETVYGLGADGTNPAAVAKIYAAKGRPHFNPLIAHVADVDAAFALGTFSPEAKALAHAFWPGPLTLVVPLQEHCPVCDLARAGLGSLAIRVPAHPVAQGLIRAAGMPVMAPSANRSGHISPTKAAHVLADLDGRIDAILMGDDAQIGLESTILACLDADVTLLRPGAITKEMAEAAIGHALSHAGDGHDAAPRAPGRLASHYAPRAKLRLHATYAEPGEACLTFGPALLPGAEPGLMRNLSLGGDLTEAAANLYTHLRALDALGVSSICVAALPETGIGAAIQDRLNRAAAPR